MDEAAGTETTTLVGALLLENVGQAFTCTISVAGDELTLRLDGRRTDHPDPALEAGRVIGQSA